MIASSVDIYVTYRCNLRCQHCFVGDRLKTSENFDPHLLSLLINSCSEWQTKEITFLGGEPTLYPGIGAAIESVHELGMNARIVTNGLAGLRRLIGRLHDPVKPMVGFSIDGSRAEVHDAVRGGHAFDRMVANIARCKNLGFPVFGVTSISRQNVDDALGIVALSRSLGLKYLNVHYVVPVGFAVRNLVLPPEEWQVACLNIRKEAEDRGIQVRIEELLQHEDDDSDSDPCAVRNDENLMFLPDGRVFSCPLFMDLPDAHSYRWTEAGLSPNQSASSEKAICHNNLLTICSAMPLVGLSHTTGHGDGSARVGCVLRKVSYGAQALRIAGPLKEDR
jgi:MoaA/NifB/PqqE/SkfB family radical SAM enzyme